MAYLVRTAPGQAAPDGTDRVPAAPSLAAPDGTDPVPADPGLAGFDLAGPARYHILSDPAFFRTRNRNESFLNCHNHNKDISSLHPHLLLLLADGRRQIIILAQQIVRIEFQLSIL